MISAETAQVVGVGLQTLGVLVLISGVLRTRIFLGDRPLRDKATAPLRRWWRKVLGRPPVALTGRVEMTADAILSVGGVVVKPDWSKLSSEGRLRRLQEIADRHEEELTKAGSELRKERREREEADRREQAERQRLGTELEKRIRDASAAGLTREMVGSALVLVGNDGHLGSPGRPRGSRPSLGPRLAVPGHPLHRAPGGGWSGDVGGVKRGLVGQRTRRDDHRPLQDRARPPARTLEGDRRRRVTRRWSGWTGSTTGG